MTLVADFNASVNVPFQRIRTLLAEGGGGLQEGVAGVTDLKVAQRGAGANMSVDVPAGAAWVQIDTGTRNGLGHVFNDATANVTVTASNATNPRVDQSILRWNDSSIPTGSGNVPTLEVLTGTATAGATLDNRTGAAALPNDCLRLADILVPAASTSVTTANIRDRRPWARGGFAEIVFTGSDQTISSTTFAAISTMSAAIQQRVECSGAPVRIEFSARVNAPAAASAYMGVLPAVDAAVPAAFGTDEITMFSATASGNAGRCTNSFRYTPVAGSHLFTLWAKVSSGTAVLNGSTVYPLRFTVYEDVRPIANNGVA